MKNLLRLQSILMLLLFFVAITGCNKDDDDNGGGGDNPAQTNYRLKESVSTGDEKESIKDVYSYESDNLSGIMEYTGSEGNWAESEKTEVSYPSDNSFEMITSNYAEGDWNPSEREVVTHQDGAWQTYLTYDYMGANWSLTEKIVYTYSSGKITKEEGFVYPGGQEQNEYKYNYTYVGDVPSAIDRYMWSNENWESIGKDTLTFSNGKLISVQTNMEIEGMPIIMKSEYEYSGDKVSKITVKMKYGEMWVDFETVVFTYDEHGNLTTMSGSGEYFEFSDTFTYEEGNSNWALINGMPGFINYYGMGFSKSFQKINNEVNKIALSVLSQR